MCQVIIKRLRIKKISKDVIQTNKIMQTKHYDDNNKRKKIKVLYYDDGEAAK